MGIGTLIVFIAKVLVAAIAVGVLINTAGFLQSKSEQTGQQSGALVTNRLQVVAVTGTGINSDAESIGIVELTVKRHQGRVTSTWRTPRASGSVRPAPTIS